MVQGNIDEGSFDLHALQVFYFYFWLIILMMNMDQTTFDSPPGVDPVALNLGSMGKGEAWVNGLSIGRYWVSRQTPKGRPSQSL